MHIQRIGGRGVVNHAYDFPSDEKELEHNYATAGDPTYQDLDGTQAKPNQNVRS